MKKPQPGQPILITIGGRELELKFPLRIVKRMDTEQGISVLRGTGMAAAFSDPERLALITHYGLQTKHPDITLDWVQDEVDASMLLTLGPLLAFATTGRWPKIGEQEETPIPNEGQVEPIRGLPSGLSEDTILELVNANSGS
jgi:hypothetical protein